MFTQYPQENAMQTAKIQTQTAIKEQETVQITAEISKGALATVGGISVLIGLWAVACFAGGMLASGGPLTLAKQWFEAVSGM